MTDERYNRAGRIGKVIRGKWRIDARLGEGATATVYAATHRNGHRVALKVLHPQFLRDAQIRARFMREAYVGNAIVHPGVVRVLDDDVTEDGSAFLVMELLEGESFEARAERNGGRLPVVEVVWLLDSLLDVLSVAHKKNIVHRDIKPDNLFLTRERIIKVLDFGFARMKEMDGESSGGDGPATSLTKTGFILGTPDFMSPEQAGGRNHDVDARSDLWSAAATAFCLISGQRVHSGALTLHQHLLLTATARARSLGSIDPGLPAGLIAVIDRALALERERRWPDADAMRTALRAAVGALHEPPSFGGGDDPDVTEVYPQRARKPVDLADMAGVDVSEIPPTDPAPPAAGYDESVIFVGAHAALSYRAAPVIDAPSPPAQAAFAPPPPPPPPPQYALPERPVPLLVGPTSSALMRPAAGEATSRTAITASRRRPQAFEHYFVRWMFFLVVATIAAIVAIIGVARMRQVAQMRHPVSFSTQPVAPHPAFTPSVAVPPAVAGSAAAGPASANPTSARRK